MRLNHCSTATVRASEILTVPKLTIHRNTSNIFCHPWGWVAGSNLDHDLLQYLTFLKTFNGAVWRYVCTRETHCVFQRDGSPRWMGGHVRQWLNETYPRKLVENYDWLRDLHVSFPPVALRTDFASLTGFAVALTGHTTLGRTPLDEWSARRRDLYLTTEHSQETGIHSPGGRPPRLPYQIGWMLCGDIWRNTLTRSQPGLPQVSWQDFRQLWQRSRPTY